MVWVTVLLILIFLVLLGIFISFNASFSTILNQNKQLYGEIIEARESLTFSAGKLSGISESIEIICRDIEDIKRQSDNFEKFHVKEAINTLKDIDVGLMELKGIQDTLTLVESSLNTITAHPAFTGAEDDL